MNNVIKCLFAMSLVSTVYGSAFDLSGSFRKKLKSCLKQPVKSSPNIPTTGRHMKGEILVDGGQLVIDTSGQPLVRYTEQQLERMAASGDAVVVYKQRNGLVRELDDSTLETSCDVALEVLAEYLVVRRDVNGNVVVANVSQDGSEGPSTIVIEGMSDAQLQRVLAEYGMVSPVCTTAGGRQRLEVVFGADNVGNFESRNIVALHLPDRKTRFWNGDTGHRLPAQITTRFCSVRRSIQGQVGWMLTGNQKRNASIVGMVFNSEYVFKESEYAQNRYDKLGAVKSVRMYEQEPSITELTEAEVNVDDTLTQK